MPVRRHTEQIPSRHLDHFVAVRTTNLVLLLDQTHVLVVVDDTFSTNSMNLPPTPHSQPSTLPPPCPVPDPLDPIMAVSMLVVLLLSPNRF
jgi:hypothetical protein